MRLTFRQGIVQYQIPTFLAVGPSFVSLVVTNTPTIITIANGASDYLYIEQASVPNAWGPLLTGIDAWLYWDLNQLTAERTFGVTLVDPVVAGIAPPSPAVDTHWFDLTTQKMYVWNGARWVERIRVFACKMDNGVIPVSMSINSPTSFEGTQVGSIPGDYFSGQILFDAATGQPIRTPTGQFITTETELDTKTVQTAMVKFASLVIEGEAQVPMAAYTIVKYTDYGEIYPADQFVATMTPYGIIQQDADTGQIVNVTTTGAVANPIWDFSVAGGSISNPDYVLFPSALPVNSLLYTNATGQLTSVPSVPLQVAVATVIARSVILLDIPTTTGGSGSTTVNPATTTTFGTVKINIPPAVPGNPVAVGDNDPRLTQAVLRTGDTMTGLLILSGDPVDPLGAATKQYVDAATTLSLDDLTDVVLTLPTPGQALIFDGVNWENTTLTLNSLDDVLVTAPAPGETLQWNGTDFVNATPIVALNDIQNATGSATRTHGVNAIIWNWTLTGDTTAFEFGEGTASAGGTGSQVILSATTEAGSTANPFRVTQTGLALPIIDVTNSGTIANGYSVNIRGAVASTALGVGGDVNITSGASFAAGTSAAGDVNVTGGTGTGVGVDGGMINITGGASATSTGGIVNITSGTGSVGGNVDITAAAGITGTGGNVNITSGAGLPGPSNQGSVVITTPSGGNSIAGVIDLQPAGTSRFKVDGVGTYYVTGSEGLAGQAIVSQGPGLPTIWANVSGGGAIEPLNQIVYGTGVGIDSSPTFMYDATVTTLNVGDEGNTFTVQGLDGLTLNSGGVDFEFNGGNADGNGNGGGFVFNAGNSPGSGPGGSIDLNAGTSVTGAGGNVSLTAGTGATNGIVTLTGGNGDVLQVGASITLTTAGGSLALTNTGEISINSNPGTAGQAIVSGGPGVPPTWQTVSATVAEPATQIVYGTGAGVDSSSEFTYSATTKALTFTPTSVASPGDITLTAASSTGLLGANIAVTAGNGSLVGGNIDISAGLGTNPGVVRLITNGVTRLVMNSDGEWNVNGSPNVLGYVLTSNGPNTPPSWQAAGSASEFTTTKTNNQGVTVVPGAPVYISSAGNVQLGDADVLASSELLGLNTASVLNGATATIRMGGQLTLTTGEWDAVAGTSGGLTEGTVYYLSTATGLLTSTPPNVTGQYVARVGKAISSTTMFINLMAPIVA